MAKNKGGYILVLEVLEVIVRITLLAPRSPVLGSSPLGQSLNIFPNFSVRIPGNETPNISKNGTMPQAPWLDNVEKKNSWMAGLKEQKS